MYTLMSLCPIANAFACHLYIKGSNPSVVVVDGFHVKDVQGHAFKD